MLLQIDLLPSLRLFQTNVEDQLIDDITHGQELACDVPMSIFC